MIAVVLLLAAVLPGAPSHEAQDRLDAWVAHNSRITGFGAVGTTEQVGQPVAVSGSIAVDTVSMLGGVDPHGVTRSLAVDEQGRAICAPNYDVHDAVAGVYQIIGARYDRLIRNQDELLAAVRDAQSWRYDMRSSLLGAGAALLFVAAALALLMRRGAK